MIFLVFLWAFGACWIATKLGFFSLPHQSQEQKIRLNVLQLIVPFALYFLFSLLINRVLLTLVAYFSPAAASSITGISAVIFFSNLFLLITIGWFFTSFKKSVFSRLWKDRFHQPCRPVFYDFGLGVLTWFIAFPWVTLIADGMHALVKWLFNYDAIDQNAVRFVKQTLDAPPALLFAFSTVVFLAPLIEELLFRGILQTWIKQWLGAKSAILLSALLFALFHYSGAQGLANIVLMAPLILLGLFLGFLYEKQGSLWSPIGLHMLFNAVTALRILFTGGEI